MIRINVGESLTNALYLRKMKQKDCAVLDMRPSEFIALGEEA